MKLSCALFRIARVCDGTESLSRNVRTKIRTVPAELPSRPTASAIRLRELTMSIGKDRFYRLTVTQRELSRGPTVTAQHSTAVRPYRYSPYCWRSSLLPQLGTSHWQSVFCSCHWFLSAPLSPHQLSLSALYRCQQTCSHLSPFGLLSRLQI